jgi:hypothetical protein
MFLYSTESRGPKRFKKKGCRVRKKKQKEDEGCILQFYRLVTVRRKEEEKGKQAFK